MKKVISVITPIAITVLSVTAALYVKEMIDKKVRKVNPYTGEKIVK